MVEWEKNSKYPQTYGVALNSNAISISIAIDISWSSNISKILIQNKGRRDYKNFHIMLFQKQFSTIRHGSC